MPKTKLSQSLMHTIDGGKSNEESMPDNVVNDAFEQAEQNAPTQELSEAKNDSLSDREPKIQFENMEETISPGEPLEASTKIKPEKIKAPKQKEGRRFVGVVSLLLSVIAIGIAGYSIVSLKAGQVATMKNMESLDSAIGNLNSKNDELTAALAGTKKDVQLNTDSLMNVSQIRGDVENLQSTISEMRAELNAFKNDLEAHSATISDNQKQIKKLGAQLKKLGTRRTRISRKVVRKAPSKTVNTDPSLIEGAYVASIDLWGTQSSVMLREENGGWVPLTIGDYYKGWRLESAIGSEAKFRKGSKTKRLTIKE